MAQYRAMHEIVVCNEGADHQQGAQHGQSRPQRPPRREPRARESKDQQGKGQQHFSPALRHRLRSEWHGGPQQLPPHSDVGTVLGKFRRLARIVREVFVALHVAHTHRPLARAQSHHP
jgi:hypothetical protein